MLIDFGASRVKAATVNTESGVFSQVRSFRALPNVSRLAGHYEISAQDLHLQFSAICKYYSRLGSIAGIFISSQMHGFLAVNKNGKPISNYISWKDERSLHGLASTSTFEELKNRLGKFFKKITGMKPRPSFPFFNAAHWAKTQGIKQARLISLPDWLAMVNGKSNAVSHPTMLAGLGFYDIYNNQISSELISVATEFSGCEFVFNKPSSHDQVAGYLIDKKIKVPIYTGVGDHQAAVLGAGNLPKQSISINIGTGSQVSVIGLVKHPEVEFRPYFNGQILSTITHIPAGRALDFYLGQILKTTRKKIWRKIKTISLDDIKKSKQKINLAIFLGAWHYNSAQPIFDFTKSGLNTEKYLAALIKSLSLQYTEVVKIFGLNRKIKKIILSGGVPNKIPQLKILLEDFTKMEVISPSETEETFLGLKKLASAITSK